MCIMCSYYFCSFPSTSSTCGGHRILAVGLSYILTTTTAVTCSSSAVLFWINHQLCVAVTCRGSEHARANVVVLNMLEQIIQNQSTAVDCQYEYVSCVLLYCCARLRSSRLPVDLHSLCTIKHERFVPFWSEPEHFEVPLCLAWIKRCSGSSVLIIGYRCR